ncbi:hypothetical protein ACQKBJ_06395 [Helicobacter pylori]
MLPYDYGRHHFDATHYDYGRRLFDATITKYDRHLFDAVSYDMISVF